MPVGLIDDLKPAEVSSLLEFLKTGHAPRGGGPGAAAPVPAK